MSNHPGPRKREIKPLDRQEMAIKADVRGPAKAVLLVLAYRADSKFFDCYPSHELLAKESGFAVATVKRAIAHLIDLGLVATYSRGFKAALRYEIFPRHDSSERAIADSSESPRDSSESCATIAHSELQNRVQRTRFKRTREGDARARGIPPAPTKVGVVRTPTPEQLAFIVSLEKEHGIESRTVVSWVEASGYIDELKAMPKKPQGLRELREWLDGQEGAEVDVTPHRSVQKDEARARQRAKVRTWRDWTMEAMMPGCCTTKEAFEGNPPCDQGRALEGWPPATVWQYQQDSA